MKAYFSILCFFSVLSGSAFAEAKVRNFSVDEVAINSGSAVAIGNFSADMDFSGGATYESTLPINRANVVNPAPEEVYRSVRYGNFNYVVGGLSAGASYLIRFHLAEIYWSVPGARIFNVFVNGSSVPSLTNFDIFAEAGGKNIAVVREVSAQANGLGNIVIDFATVVDHAQINGIEVVRNPPSPPVPVNPLFKLGSNQANYQLGQSASLVVHYLAAPESSDFEYFSTSTLEGEALPVRNASRNFAVAVTPPLDSVGQKTWTVSVYLQDRHLAESLNQTVDFLQCENERIEKALSETTDPDTIAALEQEKARNLLLIERAENELTAGRRPVGSPQSLTINVL
ncbi:MAG: malectin domain-containing carbohydrate-binding protein [Bacteriovoracia bacterium]